MKTKYTLFIFLCFTQLLLAQGPISGRVTDALTQTPLPGASVYYQGSLTGTSTLADGSFLLRNNRKRERFLIISFIGYQTQSLKISPDDTLQNLQIALKPILQQVSPVVVTATRTRRKMEEIPGRMSSISRSQIEHFPATNTDDLLNSIANVTVNRSWGIFSKNAAVTMRGVLGSSRTLILLDGVPLNKMSGGSVNWHLIQPSQIEQIEVVKGPGSAIYGNNAMGGIINIITRKTQKKLEGEIGLNAAGYNTFGGRFHLSGNQIKNQRGFFWKIQGAARSGDGYIIEPYETRDSTNVKAYLDEANGNISFGYQFNNKHQIKAEYLVEKDKRGGGKQVVEDDGAFDSFETHFSNLHYEGSWGAFQADAKLFYSREYYNKQSESLSSTGKYKLSELESIKNDRGLLFNVSRSLGTTHRFTTGFDAKQGDVDATTYYRTSTDILDYTGLLNFYGWFLQDEMAFLDQRLIIVAGFRYDFTDFTNGKLSVQNPTSNTGFSSDIINRFANNHWESFSPKLSAKYFITPKQSIYLSYASGFMPPKLDDLCKSGKISKGFKIANPELNPETLNNLEVGFTLHPHPAIELKPSVYYSRGHDFQYLMGTGDSIDTGGSSLKPMLQRRNITGITVKGAEISFKWHLHKSLQLNGSYTYNHSTISNYQLGDGFGVDLTGKFLAEVPKHQAFAGLFWQHPWINVNLTWNYYGDQWFDDANSQKVKDYCLFNSSLYRRISKSFVASLTIQNIFDIEHVDRKGRLNPGRFITTEITYQF